MRLPLLVLAAFLAGAPAARATNIEFTAQADRTSVSTDESVSVKFTIRSDGAFSSIDGPRFNAPGFDVVNEYTGQFVESYYENGRFGMRNIRTVTQVLKPKKAGRYRIDGLSVKVDGRSYSAPSIDIEVESGGAVSPPPRSYGGGVVPAPQPRGPKRAPSTGFFVRAEVDKRKLYKGEQLIVSYYLYQRSRVFNLSVDKYPTLAGFLREDLDMPILGQRLDSDQVLIDGVAYNRALLVRYAAYPIKDGKLSIDAMAIKASYYGGQAGGDDDDPFMNFFQQMAPRIGTSRSDVISIEVEPLPETGRPASFTGGVGEFQILAVADKQEVRANEAVTVTVKVEGRGNAASIGEPKATLPDTVELYESKGRAKTHKSGASEKVFELLLIPRQPGKVTIPAFELSTFDPAKEAYVTRSTAPIELTVLEPAPGSAVAVAPKRAARPKAQAGPGDDTQGPPRPAAEGMRPLKEPGPFSSWAGRPLWRWLYGLGALSMLAFAAMVVVTRLGERRAELAATQRVRRLAESKSWQHLRSRSKAVAGKGKWQDVTEAYELLCGAVYDVIDRTYSVGARSISRADLGRVLVGERSLPEPIWQKISRILEFAEAVRYASSAGAVSETAARSQLEKWVREGQAVDEALARQAIRMRKAADSGAPIRMD